MGFREFMTSAWHRLRMATAFRRYQSIKPPANPSRQYVDKLVERLLNQRTAWNARRELELMGPAAVPSLRAALIDPRFHRAKWEKYSQVPAPLESTLELLVAHAPDDVVQAALPLANAPSADVRKTTALHLSSTGCSSAIPMLQEFMRDKDGYVRSYVRIGIHRAVTAGRADETFRQQAYDLLLSQCDQNWGSAGNDAAESIIAIDPVRAAVDLGDERWLNLSNRNTHRILRACNKVGILLPEPLLRRLLDEALPLATGERCYPEALHALALRKADDAAAIAEPLLQHPNEKLKESAAEAMAAWAGVHDPAEFVIARVSNEGYERLSHEQRVVYCAFLFDAEVCNGGLMQFFGNSSGDHAIDTLAALRELEHPEAQAALETAMRLVGPLARESHRERRLAAFEGRWDELQEAFDPLEQSYYATKVKLRQALLLYAVRHADHFQP